MKATGTGGPAVTATRGIEVPTRPAVRPADWPARPERTAWTSPIRPAAPPAATDRSATAARTTVTGSSTNPRTQKSRKPAPTRKPSPSQTADARSPSSSSASWSASSSVGATDTVDASGGLVEELRARWAAGEPQVVIAAALGISVTRLQRLRRAHGIARRRRPVDAAEAIRLYVDEQLSLDEVAARLGTVAAAVRYQLRKAEVTSRPVGARRGRPDQVRAEALARIAAGERPVDVQRGLGIGESTLLRWRRTHTTTTTTTTSSTTTTTTTTTAAAAVGAPAGGTR